MAELYLIRHARSAMNDRPDLVGGRSNHSPLTTKGEAEAHQLGLWIAKRQLNPDVVYASPAVRTRETARIALDVAGIAHEPIIDDRLQELSQGFSEGKPRDEIYTPELISGRINKELKDFRLDGGESMNDVSARKTAWSEFARSRAEHRLIFAFTHGFAIRCYVGNMLGWDHGQIRDNQVDNASVTIVNFTEDGELLNVYYNVNTQATL